MGLGTWVINRFNCWIQDCDGDGDGEGDGDEHAGNGEWVDIPTTTQAQSTTDDGATVTQHVECIGRAIVDEHGGICIARPSLFVDDCDAAGRILVSPINIVDRNERPDKPSANSAFLRLCSRLVKGGD